MKTLTRLIQHPLFSLLIRDDRQPSLRTILIVADVVMVIGVMLVGWGIISEADVMLDFTLTMAQYGCILTLALPVMLTLAAVTYSTQMIRRVNSFDQLRLLPLTGLDMMGILTLRVLHRARVFIAGGLVLLVIMTAMFGLQPEWANEIDEAYLAYPTDTTPTSADYLTHSAFWAIVSLGLFLLLPLGAVIGVFYSVVSRRSESNAFCAPTTMFAVILVLGGLFAVLLVRTHLSDSRLHNPIDGVSLLLSVICCPTPIALLTAGFFVAGVRLYQRR